MTTPEVNSAGDSNRNVTIKLQSLVKLRSFNHQLADRTILRLGDSTSLDSSADQLSANQSSIYNVNKEKTINDDADSTFSYHEKITPESRNDLNKTELILNSHSEDEYIACKAHALLPDEISTLSETSILIMENKSTISKDYFPHSDLAHTNSPLRAFGWRNQSTTSHQHIIGTNLNVKNNFEAIRSNILQLTVKSPDSHLIKSDETNQELLKHPSLLHTKEITTASESIQPVTEAYSEITRNRVSSVTVSETTKQDCNQNSNNTGNCIGANMQITSSQMCHAENCDWNEPIEAGDRITSRLKVLTADLEEMRETDLALLKQLMAISQGIQRLRRADLMRSSRSMSLTGSFRNLQLRYRSMERQISAPLAAICRRDSFSYRRASTEDGLVDSLCSLDEVDSRLQIQLDESNSSLDILYTNTRSSSSPAKLYHDHILSYDLTENTEEAYEDILRRNIRLWKIGSQGQDFSEEMVVV